MTAIAMTPDQAADPTAAAMIIGDEILSGRTQDSNLAYIARFLGALGIALCEGRIVPDTKAEIAGALNALRARYTYVFATGGIGPTHDDITADAVAAAFDVETDYHAEALALLAARYKPGEFNEMRRRMALFPKGAVLIRNSVSTAPGFQIGNVFVMAGVPMIMRAMLEDVASRLTKGRAFAAETISARVAEGHIAAALARLQREHATVSIGSYPYFREDGSGVQFVVRGRESSAVEAAAQALERILAAEEIEAIRVRI